MNNDTEIKLKHAREIKESGRPYARWIDNFNKIYGYQMPSLAHGTYHSLMWMGCAVRVPRQPCLVQNLDVEPEYPGMPDDLWNQDAVELVVTLMQKVWRRARRCTMAASLCTKYEVNNIPLKPVVDEAVDKPLHDLLASSPDGMSNFYPEGVVNVHIGSNDGLAKEFRRNHDEIGQEADGQKKYRLLVCDENIFRRGLKV